MARRLTGVLLTWTWMTGLSVQYASAISLGGDVTAGTDYIFRGISQNDGHPVAQLDLHVGSLNGYFAGVWATTLDGDEPRSIEAETQIYAGKRFDLSSAWNVSLSAVDYSYLHHAGSVGDNYQELSAAVSYLDGLTLSVAASPNAVRYWKGYRLGRYPAYDTDVMGQWPIARNLFLTGGAGYYFLTGPTPHSRTTGYGYGNAGFAVEWRAWRLDAGYFFTSSQAERLFPYRMARNRVAATLNWRF